MPFQRFKALFTSKAILQKRFLLMLRIEQGTFTQSVNAAPRRSSQGQVDARPSAPRQPAARPASGERRYSQPAEPRLAARPGMGLEGGQQGGGPTAEQRFASCPAHVTFCKTALLFLAVLM